MVLMTGDIHGKPQRIVDAIHKFGLTKDDVVVILGDAGFNFYGNRKGDVHTKGRMNKAGVPVLCIHGNHEMRPETVKGYREMEWHGGVVYVEDAFPNLLFAKDGEVYDFDGKKVIAIGGAYSVDKWHRLQCDINWFADEQPSAEIKARVERKLDELGWKVDYVFSHTCPTRYTPTEAFMPGLDQSKVDKSTEEWLDSICERLDYDRWYCGHWHIDKRLESFRFLMNDFEELEVGKETLVEVFERAFSDTVQSADGADMACVAEQELG